MFLKGFDLDKCNQNSKNQLFLTIRGMLPPQLRLSWINFVDQARPRESNHESGWIFCF